jgi:hypothetical protein
LELVELVSTVVAVELLVAIPYSTQLPALVAVAVEVEQLP